MSYVQVGTAPVRMGQRDVTVPLKQSTAQPSSMVHQDRVWQYNVPMIASNWFSQGSQVPFQIVIPKAQIQTINWMELLFDITISNSNTQLVPTCAWLNRVTFTWDGDTLPFLVLTRTAIIAQTLALLRDPQRAGLLYDMNFSKEEGQYYTPSSV